MSIIVKAKEMLFGKSQKPDPLEAQIAIAVQRNEQAGEKVRRALEEYQMSQTILQIVERM